VEIAFPLTLAAALALGSLAGCGSNALGVRTYAVKGQVLLHDGKPLTAGGVEFVNVSGPAVTATGQVGPDGSFTLKTEGLGDGAPLGDYRVRIVPDASFFTSKQTRKAHVTTIDKRKLPYDIKYTDEDTSGLTAVVKAQDNQIEPLRLSR
jgi:hypothetical protein